MQYYPSTLTSRNHAQVQTEPRKQESESIPAVRLCFLPTHDSTNCAMRFTYGENQEPKIQPIPWDRMDHG
uniref:Uncharacterized protein n=1 Tax=Arundo donax TaxID=35708 RepID=A0A0A9F0L0_ARUDO